MRKILILGSYFTLLTLYAMAQTETNVADTLQLPEVTVSSLKFDIPLKETAHPVHIITREIIEQNQGKDLAQLLQEQSGVIINGAYSNPGTVKGVYLRGASSEHTLILVDGTPAFDPSGLGSTFDIRLLPVSQIERIEIMKGNQSTLFGSGAIAGVINIITAKAATKNLETKGHISGGSLSTLDAGIGIGGTTRLIDYQIGINRQSTAGISEALSPSQDLEFENDKSRQTSMMSALSIKLNEKIKVQPFFRFIKTQNDFDTDAFVDGDNQYKSEYQNLGAFGDLNYKKFRARIGFSQALTDRFYYTTFGENEYHGRLLNIESYAAYDVNRKLTMLGGIDFQQQHMLDSTSSEVDPSVYLISPYLKAIFRPVKHGVIEIGTRMNQHSKFGNHANYSITPAYWITKDLKIFANWSTGFKAPTLSQLFGQWGGNTDLNPQTSDSWEIGIQQYFDDARFGSSLSYFRRNIKNLIVYDFTAGYHNRDEQRDQGLELQMKWKMHKKISFSAGYDFTTGQITESRASIDTSFNNLIRRPKHSLKLAAAYRPNSSLSLSLNSQYIGKRIDYYFNPAKFYALETVSLDAYFLVNAYLEYSAYQQKLTFFADLKNITNIEFVEIYGYTTLKFNARFGLRFHL